ncbi:hypothetical protein C8F04DRAFT_1133444 [Mycena alexandri]|uniref:Uncharacterized protein n=1 Tax=Mycena alexandri TaxID=1745969 RepID=A0AAD6SCU9_9AGAR|nr:hypothetical protein C8F04DRAFT_1133444 [Mycena alexandri]
MPRPGALLVCSLPIPLLAGVIYHQHRRLATTYPTLRVPPSLEISARRDKPAFGMSGVNDTPLAAKETWLHTPGGDMWTATVPRRLLTSRSEDARDGPLIAFARAFWSSWPLKIERRIVTALARMGILFQTRSGASHVSVEEERKFVEKAQILGGLFIVEANDRGVSKGTHGPLVTSWWLRPVEDNGHVGLLGGYHSFAVEDIPLSDADEEPSVRLCFVSHLVLSPCTNIVVDAPCIPTYELQGFSLRQRLIMHFHVLYSRILLDLAVQGLERGAVVG